MTIHLLGTGISISFMCMWLGILIMHLIMGLIFKTF